MPLLHLPFITGQSEAVDPKVAPAGTLKLLQNARIEKDGRIRKRPGLTSIVDSNVSISFDEVATLGDELVAVTQYTDANSKQTRVLYGYSPSSPNQSKWVSKAQLSSVGAPRRRNVVSGHYAGDPKSPTLAVVGNFLCVAWESELQTPGLFRIIVHIYDLRTWGLVHIENLLGNVYMRNPVVIATGTRFVLFWFDALTNEIYHSSLDTTVAFAWSTKVLVAAATSSLFGACRFSSTVCLVAYRSNVTQITARAVNAATGASLFSPVTTTTAAGPTNGITINSSDENYSTMVWVDAANDIYAKTYRQVGSVPFASSSGNTKLNSSSTAEGMPFVVASAGDTTHTVGWLDITSGVQKTLFAELQLNPFHSSVLSSGTITLCAPVSAASPKFRTRTFVALTAGGQFDRTGFVLGATSWAGDTALQYQARVECSFSRGELVTADPDTRPSDVATYVDADGVTHAYFAAVTRQSGSVAATDPYNTVCVFDVPLTTQRQFAEIGGLLYMSGGVPSLYDGERAAEIGLLSAPQIRSVSASAGAGFAAGTYSWRLTAHVFDASGRQTISAVSDPVSITTGATSSAFTVTANSGVLSNRFHYFRNVSPSLISPSDTGLRMFYRLWRTTPSADGGEIFHEVTPPDGVAFDPSIGFSTTTVTISDTLVDATAAANAILYTQGARGALSGPLQHDPPPPFDFFWAGKSRVIIGGLERRDEVRFSKYYYPGETLEFSEDLAFRAHVTGDVTAVAYLDDSAVVFTRHEIFAVFGEGPDDTGAGSFDDPRKVPSEVGCITAHSLVEVPSGLMFQGMADRIYLLPRGLGAPVWVGQPVRDTLAQFPIVVGAQLISEQGRVAFVCVNTARDAGRVLVYDLRSGQWSVDTYRNGQAYSGATTHGGSMVLCGGADIDMETPGIYIDAWAAWYGMTVEMQPIRPHGLIADGRTRELAVLGEYLGDCQLVADLAVDDGQSYPYSHTWQLVGLTPGEPLQRVWQIPTQKAASLVIRLREAQHIPVTGPGCALHGITLETFARGRTPRVRTGWR